MKRQRLSTHQTTEERLFGTRSRLRSGPKGRWPGRTGATVGKSCAGVGEASTSFSKARRRGISGILREGATKQAATRGGEIRARLSDCGTRCERAFTLIELAVVIAVVLVLLAYSNQYLARDADLGQRTRLAGELVALSQAGLLFWSNHVSVYGSTTALRGSNAALFGLPSGTVLPAQGNTATLDLSRPAHRTALGPLLQGTEFSGLSPYGHAYYVDIYRRRVTVWTCVPSQAAPPAGSGIVVIADSGSCETQARWSISDSLLPGMGPEALFERNTMSPNGGYGL